MTIAFACQGLFPFGNNQIMIVDSWHQYYPFLQELQEKLTHGGSLLYSWNSGLGSNFFLIMAYYAISPLYLLSVLFPKEYLREFMMIATIFKISLAGMFFAIYIRAMFKRSDISIIVFGLMYAFCGYAMGYYWNIMWLDSMALLPLIILGLNRLLDEEGYVLFTISLALAMICNFFIGFLICEFILIYFFILYFIKFPKTSKIHLVKKLITMGIYSVISLGISMVVLIPTFKGLQLAYTFSSGKPAAFETYFSILDILNNLLANVPVSVRSGLPNIYCGFFAVLLCVFYFLSTTISIRTKMLNFFLLMFLLFSFNINYLNYIWHGFRFPNEIPYRFAFIVSFLILSWAYQAFLKLDEITIKTVWHVSVIFFIYLLICEKIYTDTFDYTVFYINLIILAVYSGAILLLKYQRIPQKVFTGFICCIILGEVLLSALNGTQAVGSSNRTNYPPQNDAVTKVVEDLYDVDNSFYRLEMLKWYSENDPVLYGYRGISKFSSTTNSNVTIYVQKLGLAASPEANRYLYASSTPIVNALLSIKYLMGKGDIGNIPNAGFAVMGKEDELTYYKNNYYLPLGFMVDDSITDWNMSLSNPFNVQEEFLESATAQEGKVFHNIAVSKESYVNMDKTSLNGMRYSYNNTDSSKVGTATLSYTVAETKQMYLYFFANKSYHIKVMLNGKDTEYETRRGQIIDLGIIEKGTSFDVSFEVFAEAKGYFNLQAVTFDEETFSAAYKELADEVLEIEEFSDTQIKGRIQVVQDGSLYMAIPYEKGWTARVDGKKTEIIPLKDAMMILPLTEGYHTIELNYCPDGLIFGIFISLSSIVVLLCLCIISRIRKKYEKNNIKVM